MRDINRIFRLLQDDGIFDEVSEGNNGERIQVWASDSKPCYCMYEHTEGNYKIMTLLVINPQQLAIERYEIALKQMVTAIRNRGIGGGYWQRWGQRECPVEYPTNTLRFSTTIENSYDDYADDYYEQEQAVDEYADLEEFEKDEEYVYRFKPKNQAEASVKTVIDNQSQADTSSPVQQSA